MPLVKKIEEKVKKHFDGFSALILTIILVLLAAIGAMWVMS